MARRFYNTVVVYVLILIVAMLLSIATKRTIPRLAPTVLVSSKRSFGLSWTRGDSQKHNSNAGSSSSEATSQTSIPLAATASAGNNYDALTFNSLINYQVAVAFQPKNRTETNKFKKSKPSPALASPSGEDNLFVSKQVHDGYLAVGVADGVGGWSEAGYDSSAISRELCLLMKNIFETSTPSLPKQLLQEAFSEISSSDKVEIGGTTACLGILTPDKRLQVANLGDSWCGVFRDYKLVEETKFQTHNFNTPYQLAKIPPHILKQAADQGKRYIVDTPQKADEYEWALQKDDIVIFATDGVTDNVVPDDMAVFLRDQFSVPNPDLEAISKKLVSEVVKVSKDPNFASAFAQELSRLTGQRYLGGKEDDITVVVVRVK